MTDRAPKIRLFVKTRLAAQAEVDLPEAQAHYLCSVMRRRVGDAVALFNGLDGEWLAEVARIDKKRCELVALSALRPQAPEPDLWLLFAPIKRARLDYVVEKVTELGAALIQPVMTEHTAVARVNLDRLSANAAEAAEQCRRLSVPEIASPAESLNAALAAMPAGRRLLAFDNGLEARPASAALPTLPSCPDALLIGPEGGLSDAERALVRRRPNAYMLSLGPRVLRAETAIVAALTLWQAFQGDWR